MKSACRAAALGAILAGGISAARADDSKPITLAPVEPSSMQETPHVTPGPPVDPDASTSLQDDPEAAVAQEASLHEEFLQRQAVFNAEAAARQQAYDSDWMLRGYDAELKSEKIGTSADRDTAESLEVADPNAPRKTDGLASSTTDKGDSSTRPPADDLNSTADASTSNAPAPLFLPPLLPPEGGPNSPKQVTRLDAWGSTTTLEPVPALNPNSPFFSLGKDHEANPDPAVETSLDVPGLTAERQGLGDMNDAATPDQQLEAITENDNRARKDFLIPTVAGNDSAEFFKRQSEALTAPNADSMLHPTASGNIPLGPPPPPPPPSRKMPLPTGIRSHVDDPFDLIGGHRD